MSHRPILFLFLFVLPCCSVKQSEQQTGPDSLSSAPVAPITEAFPELDLDNFEVFDPGDSVIDFPDLVSLQPDEDEPQSLKADPRIKRTPQGLEFQLENGSIKRMKDKTDTDGDDYKRYTYLFNLDEIGQWFLMGSYYESFNYVMVDQSDGTEKYLWGIPVLSPNRKFFLTTQMDLEAGFVANGFQLWHIENNKPVLVWEKELETWGAGDILWEDNDHIIASQTYRDEKSGQLTSRLIKIKVTWKE